MLTNEISNNEMSKNHQVIGSNVVRILKFDLTFWSIDMIERIFVCFNGVVNLANSIRLGLITHLPITISVNLMFNYFKIKLMT